MKPELPHCNKRTHEVMAWAFDPYSVRCPFCDKTFVMAKGKPWWRFWA